MQKEAWLLPSSLCLQSWKLDVLSLYLNKPDPKKNPDVNSACLLWQLDQRILFTLEKPQQN